MDHQLIGILFYHESEFPLNFIEGHPCRCDSGNSGLGIVSGMPHCFYWRTCSSDAPRILDTIRERAQLLAIIHYTARVEPVTYNLIKYDSILAAAGQDLDVTPIMKG